VDDVPVARHRPQFRLEPSDRVDFLLGFTSILGVADTIGPTGTAGPTGIASPTGTNIASLTDLTSLADLTGLISVIDVGGLISQTGVTSIGGLWRLVGNSSRSGLVSVSLVGIGLITDVHLELGHVSSFSPLFLAAPAPVVPG
jgi:hypothetical protein